MAETYDISDKAGRLIFYTHMDGSLKNSGRYENWQSVGAIEFEKVSSHTVKWKSAYGSEIPIPSWLAEIVHKVLDITAIGPHT